MLLERPQNRAPVRTRTEPTAGQSSYFVRSASVGLCHEENNTNGDFFFFFTVNIYIEKIVQIQKDKSFKRMKNH